jgi:hypothetical protein
MRPIQLARAFNGLAAAGLVAIGASGLIAEILGRAFGPAFVAGDLPGITYTPERCAQFTGLFPGKGCLEAAALDHWGEVVVYRVAAGVLGLILAAIWYALRREPADHLSAREPERDLSAIMALPLFGVATAALLLSTLNAAAAGPDHGVGAGLSAAIVALAAFVLYILPFRRAVTAQPTT